MDNYLRDLKKTARIKFRDGETIFGTGFGTEGIEAAELCFNTAMTGYQEILTDPSYHKQILTFTFPHIGNVGTNEDDNESVRPYLSGIVTNNFPTNQSNWRSKATLIKWMEKNRVIGICNVDTRQIVHKLRDEGAQDVAIEYSKNGIFSDEKLNQLLTSFRGLNKLDLAKEVTCKKPYNFTKKSHRWISSKFKINKRLIVIDYGIKTSILNYLASYGFEIIVVPADFSFKEILALNPNGILLSNGPGDPAATNEYSGTIIKSIISETNLPVFGICLGHQLLGLALGAITKKMHHGHHGANHPVKEILSGKIAVTSMNHGFTIDTSSLPDNVQETHISLFDGTNCGIQLKGRPIFSVQFHPEASPGPMDANILFHKFAMSVNNGKAKS